MLTKVQPSAMEIDMNALGSTKVKRRATIMDKATLLDKGICIPNPDRYMWIQMKYKYDKHFERMENGKEISEEE
jgi:predicted transglutaminase-like protease